MYGETTAMDSMGTTTLIVILALGVYMIVVQWKVYTKAGKPGWGILIPIYNTILLLEIAQRPIWWIILMMIPLVNIAVAIIVTIDVARNFNKGIGFGIGMLFLPIIFYSILAFDDSEYMGEYI